MIYLAVNHQENSNIGIKKISKDLDLPSPFLGKILQNLVKEGMLSSTKGPHGGFSLKKDPNDISMYDIVKVIDGESVFEDCFLGLKICEENPEHADNCEFRKTSHGVRLQLKKAYQQQTVGSFADSINNSEEKIKF